MCFVFLYLDLFNANENVSHYREIAIIVVLSTDYRKMFEGSVIIIAVIYGLKEDVRGICHYRRVVDEIKEDVRGICQYS